MSPPSAPEGKAGQGANAPASDLAPRPTAPRARQGDVAAGQDLSGSAGPGDAAATGRDDGREAGCAAGPGGGEAAGPGGGEADVGRNRVATAALVAGAAGFTLITIIPAVALALVGLRRAMRRGWRGARSGFARSVTGLALALIWAAAGAYVAPHVLLAADPGCAAYKGVALTAYNRVIADFNNGADPNTYVHDLSVAIGELDRAAARSSNENASAALLLLARRLAAVRADIAANRTVPHSALAALNRGAVQADAACGTLNL